MTLPTYTVKQNYVAIEEWHRLLEKEMLDASAKEMQKDIEWGVTCDMLKDIGWVPVTVDVDKYSTMIDHQMFDWCNENLKGIYKSRGRTWIFELEHEAAMFVMRWL